MPGLATLLAGLAKEKPVDGAAEGLPVEPLVLALLPKVNPGLPPPPPPLPRPPLPKPLLGALLAAEPKVNPVEGRAEELLSLLAPLPLLLLLPNMFVLAGAALEEDDEGLAPNPKPPKGLLLVAAAGWVGLDVEVAGAEAPPEELPKPKRNPSSAGLLTLPLPPVEGEEPELEPEPNPPAEPKPPKVGVGVEDAARGG